MAFPDASLNTQLEGGDSGVQNLFIYGKLNYNFDNEDLKVKSINISDKVTATSFTGTNFTGSFAGSGANLTEIPDNAIEALTAAKLTGALPAIDGSSLTGLDTFLKGMIILWYGNTSNIPNGFALCDGTQETPDLRSRFIIGADADATINGVVLPTTSVTGAATTTGGSKDATLVSHQHGPGSYSAVSDGSHSHNYNFRENAFSRTDNDEDHARNTGSAQYTTSEDGAHTHSITGSSSTEGSSATNANLPPYYALCYIMKL